ncbi:MAG: methionine synthase [Planctomycetota bacterium]
MKSQLLDALKDRVVVIDGAMGTSVYAHELSLEYDYSGCENCPEILVETRPDVIKSIHDSFLAVGVDCIETDTFGANKGVLAEFGLEERTYLLNKAAAELARRCADKFSTPEQPRFVLGAMGPGTKLPSLGHTTFDILEDSYTEQARGLLDGGADALIVETCQDILQAKAAVCGATFAMRERGHEVPIIVLATIEATGTMLVGTEIAAAMVALETYPQVQVIGLNCATGPQEMSEHVRHLGRHCTRYLGVVPNAGLPQVVDGRTHYVLTPDELARWHREFVVEDGVNMVGGCCGTRPEHLAAVIEAVRGIKPRQRSPEPQPSVSSLYQATSLKQDNSFLIVGERSNSNGSRKFQRLLSEGNLDELVEIGRRQVADGSHVLDVCVDAVGRDGPADMDGIIARYVKDVTVPLMLDSTEPETIEAGLKRAGGKCIVNSVNLEDGEEKLNRICPLLKKYGAAVVALTIDEDPDEAMAKVAGRKIEIARRLHDLLTNKHGIPEEDILFDCLTFPITTGNESDRWLGFETLDGIEMIMREFPRCGSILGVSNISFGLKPAARAVLNSVFLHEATARGLTAAIVHISKILPQNRISRERWDAALDLIYDHRREDFDPLHTFINLFPDDAEQSDGPALAGLPIEDRLRRRIVDGNRTGLGEDIEEALHRYGPLEIVNTILLDGMKTVGELFGAGKMQLPFVLSSAETMKAAVAYLEPRMQRIETRSKGTLVLATVRGDVHDIGKNLVDIILSNNGYTVHNLGIRQPINNVIEAYEAHNADAIGLSGLLVKSTLVMRDDLLVLNERGLEIPVMLGGAALTRSYVEQELRGFYKGEVAYGRDAFEALSLMSRLSQGLPLVKTPRRAVAKPAPSVPVCAPRAEVPRRSKIASDVPVPPPPFWGSRVIEKIDLRAVLGYINETMLFQLQWQYKRQKRSDEEFQEFLAREVRPIYNSLADRCREEGIIQPCAVYGYWPCNSDGDELVVYRPPDSGPPQDRKEVLRFRFPRQAKAPFWCLSDFWRPVESGGFDVVTFFLVTAGGRASEVAQEYFAKNLYRDYLYLHGLSVEVAEAAAEYLHKQVRMELGIAGSDALDKRKLFQKGYQGCRYSFGYPACPNLDDQTKLFQLLEPDRIGVKLSETCQLDPEQSVSAVVAHHAEARYFSAQS